MYDEQIERWDLVWSDVLAYDAEPLRIELRDAFQGLIATHKQLVVATRPDRRGGATLPPTINWAVKPADLSGMVRAVIEERLKKTFAHWYGRSAWHVGFETFGGCWCHALPKALSSGADHGADWVIAEIEAMLSALKAWAPIIERVERTDDRAQKVVAAHEATIEIIDVMINGSWLSESWYHYADDGVSWMLQAATGLALDKAPLRDLRSHSFAFTSWTAPSDAQRRSFADAAAAVIEAM